MCVSVVIMHFTPAKINVLPAVIIYIYIFVYVCILYICMCTMYIHNNNMLLYIRRGIIIIRVECQNPRGYVRWLVAVPRRRRRRDKRLQQITYFSNSRIISPSRVKTVDRDVCTRTYPIRRCDMLCATPCDLIKTLLQNNIAIPIVVLHACAGVSE